MAARCESRPSAFVLMSCPPLQVGAKWLADWCMSNSSEVPGTEVNSLAITIVSAVLGGGSGDELAAELFNLLGDAHFEAIQVVILQNCGSTT